MPKILVIPDTHLKPKMFDLADKIMAEHPVDYAVQLGDNVDDFYCYDDHYQAHYARMSKFHHDHPDTVWLWGNHEVSYILDRPVTGNIHAGKEYAYLYRENFNPKIAHLDGKVIFSHAGIFQEFINQNHLTQPQTASELIQKINQLDLSTFLHDDSPLWARPQFRQLTFPGVLSGYLQVVGHTPTKTISELNGIISTDAFSTNWGKQIGLEQMIIINTAEPSFEIININYRQEFGEAR